MPILHSITISLIQLYFSGIVLSAKWEILKGVVWKKTKHLQVLKGQCDTGKTLLPEPEWQLAYIFASGVPSATPK